MACGGVGEYRTRIGNFRNYNMRVAGFTTSSINQNESAPGGGVGVTKNKLNLKHIVGGGYLGYSILQILGNLNELMNEDVLKAKIIDYLRGLKNERGGEYSPNILSIIFYIYDDEKIFI